MEKHFVIFYSPGTLVAEQDEYPIDSWDVDTAIEISKSITQRHGATPYAFRFTTRTRGDSDLDSHVSTCSSLYYLGGTIWALEEIIARNDPHDRILISNMKGNNYARVVINDNSYRWCQPLEENDVVLDVKVGRYANT